MDSFYSLYSSHKALFWGVIVFVVSWIVLIVATPIAVAALPEDYFSDPRHLKTESPFAKGVQISRRVKIILKNVLAWFLIIVGPILFLSIFAPFFGFLLADFPAKPRLIRKFASYPLVWRLLNDIRRRRKLPFFKTCDDQPGTKNPELRTRN